MSMQKTDQALRKSFDDLALGIPFGIEGEDFDPPQSEPWAALFILPAGNAPVSLGEGGEDQEVGIFQIDISVPTGQGTADLSAYIDTLQGYYIAGRYFESDGQAVRVVSFERTQAIAVPEEWMRVSVTINWSARFVRPTF